MPNEPAHTPGTDPISLIGEAPGVFRVGMLGCVTVTVWFGRLDKESAKVLAHLTDVVIARAAGARIASVHMIDRRVRLPDAETRDALAQIMRDSAAGIACVAVIIDGSGFWASALRGFITGLQVLAPGTLDLHAHASIDQVLAWLPTEYHKRTGVQLDVKPVALLLRAGKSWQAS